MQIFACHCQFHSFDSNVVNCFRNNLQQRWRDVVLWHSSHKIKTTCFHKMARILKYAYQKAETKMLHHTGVFRPLN